jgi:hypothetical protein
MFAVSMRGNYLFGYSIGQTPEKQQLFGWANVAADVWKAVGLIALSALWRNRHRRLALIGGIAWLVCLLSGINSAIAIYVSDRIALTGSREARLATFKDIEAELLQLEEKRKRLPTPRSVGEIKAAIAAVLSEPIVIGERVRGTVGQRSADCTIADRRTIEPCNKLASLREELAAAEESDALEPRLAHLRAELTEMRAAGSAGAPDPVGEFYAWATRGLLSVRDVGFGFPLFFALLIEVVTAFGPITLARYVEVTRPKPVDADVLAAPASAGRGQLRPAPVLTVEPVHGAVAEWMAARTAPAGSAAAVSAEALYRDYQMWCSDQALAPLPAEPFGSEFERLRSLPELAGKIRRFGDRYYGMRLLQPPALPAVARRAGKR